MQALPDYKLSGKEKWQLAISIVFIYIPIRIYVSNSVLNTEIFVAKAPLWMVELLVNIVFFKIWIDIIEYLQYFFDWLDARIRFKLPSRLVTFLIGLGLAITFNFAFLMLWKQMYLTLSPHLQTATVRIGGDRNAHLFGQKTKGNTGLTIMAMLATFYLASNRRIAQRLQDVQIKSERLERENLRSQLLVLKNQISPHFLFNSFSILTSLIENDPVKSVLFVNRLSRSYRYILEQSSLELIKLKTELDFIETYTFLLKSRFEEKMQVVIDIAAVDSEQYRIAPLTLQLLIENAVKHNQMSEEKPLMITIGVVEDTLVVRNPMQLRPGKGYSTGLGLTNIVNRYKLLTSSRVGIDDSNGYFTVSIPLLR